MKPNALTCVAIVHVIASAVFLAYAQEVPEASGKSPQQLLEENKLLVLPNEGAFATIFYDYGRDSDDLLLSVRVLMRSIKDSSTRYRKFVLVPEDGLRQKTEKLFRRDGDIEIIQVDIPNVFRDTLLIDQRAHLMHMRNKLVIWDDPILNQMKRIVYLDPENLVIQNMDEVFDCHDFCAVDNGQAVVYANSLLVISPDSLPVRNLYADVIDSFMISGRSYNYIGITQGFIPGLFEAFEGSQLFYGVKDQLANDENDVERMEEDVIDRDTQPLLYRLPFYYSINHMVYYERLNWDLYKCRPNINVTIPADIEPHTDTPYQLLGDSGGIPGPLLSFKYGGLLVRPGFWLPYVYFSVFWHWQTHRARLQENHFQEFATQFVSASIIFGLIWYFYVKVCLKVFTTSSELSSGKPKRKGSNVAATTDLSNAWMIQIICRVSCNLLSFISIAPPVSSMSLVGIICLLAIFLVPSRMEPMYAFVFWLYINTLLIVTALIVIHVANALRRPTQNSNATRTTSVFLWSAFWSSLKKIWLHTIFLLMLLFFIKHAELVKNPVFRPVVLINLFATALGLQMRLLWKQIVQLSAS
uniref:Transmembrane protein putative n=1 Tax=Albugo laibachii Nc14 TaxID=890382 RepID=F0WR32_9STRA|nr:transmembrane protein putative [Albugo laibachii Nc14]|eukprot:CCA23792.1 transmembrane protein putative [Albugo laibachii Nc14]